MFNEIIKIVLGRKWIHRFAEMIRNLGFRFPSKWDFFKQAYKFKNVHVSISNWYSCVHTGKSCLFNSSVRTWSVLRCHLNICLEDLRKTLTQNSNSWMVLYPASFWDDTCIAQPFPEWQEIYDRIPWSTQVNKTLEHMLGNSMHSHFVPALKYNDPRTFDRSSVWVCRRHSEKTSLLSLMTSLYVALLSTRMKAGQWLPASENINPTATLDGA
jgi:hypothetical protein